MKIDYVVPYVDGTDAEWQQAFLKYAPKNVKKDKAELSKRYAPNLLFKYAFRSIEKFAPWINTIHLLVASKSQVPTWIDQTTVNVIVHSDFIDRDLLPTFNSGVIECFLHRIPGITDAFIYANDDMYFMNNVYPSDFFDGAMPLPICTCGINTSSKQQYDNMCKFMTQKIFKELKLPYQTGMFMRSNHTQRAFNTKIYSMIFNRFEDFILKNCSQFRTNHDITESFFNVFYYLMMQKKYKNKTFTYKYLSFDQTKNLVQFFSSDPKGYPKSVCINNNADDDILLLAKLNQLFKTKSKYEV